MQSRFALVFLLCASTAQAGIIRDWAYLCDEDGTRVYVLYNTQADSNSPAFELGFEDLTIAETNGPSVVTTLNTVPINSFAAELGLPDGAVQANFPHNDQTPLQWVEFTFTTVFLTDGAEYTFSITNRRTEPPFIAPWTTIAECVGGEDTTAPDVVCSLDCDLLWPPNGKFKNVGLSVVVTDDTDPAPTHEVFVFSDEASELTRCRRGRDAVMCGENLYLRKERAGNRDGRVYLIVIVATDEAGNVGYEVCTVVVPHDQSQCAIQHVEDQALAAEAFVLANDGELPEDFVSVDQEVTECNGCGRGGGRGGRGSRGRRR